MKYIICDLQVISDELILAGKLQLKKLQQMKPKISGHGFKSRRSPVEAPSKPEFFFSGFIIRIT